jgi:hypothetical protein
MAASLLFIHTYFHAAPQSQIGNLIGLPYNGSHTRCNLLNVHHRFNRSSILDGLSMLVDMNDLLHDANDNFLGVTHHCLGSRSDDP